MRENAQIATGKVVQLRRYQSEVDTVEAGLECGLRAEVNAHIAENDIIKFTDET